MKTIEYKKCVLIVFVCIFCKILFDILSSGKVEHPYLGYSFDQYLTNLSYHVENYTATTPDGYLLSLHRIPCERFKPTCSKDNKPSVLMVHGLLSSATEWIVQGPDTALGLRLANAGYDVWLVNNRGVLGSRNHTYLDPNNDPKFWDYSYHELGMYDLPTMIDYILNTTNKKHLYYVGNSQGVTQFLVMGSEKPQYNKKVVLATFLVPALGIKNGTGFFNSLIKLCYYVLESVSTPLRSSSILGSHSFLPRITKVIVYSNQFIFDLYLKFCIYFLGGSLEHTNLENVTYILQNGPTEASLKQFKHYVQTGVKENFRQFDYGEEENLKRYNQVKPPQYNISKITTPVAVFYSKNDQFMEESDTKLLISQLPNVIKHHAVPCENFYHQDMVLGINLNERVLNKIFNLIVQFDDVNFRWH